MGFSKVRGKIPSSISPRITPGIGREFPLGIFSGITQGTFLGISSGIPLDNFFKDFLEIFRTAFRDLFVRVR